MSRPKIEFRSASQSNYDTFCRQFPKQVTFAQFKEAIYTYNQEIANYLLQTGETVKFPYGIGEIMITKYKQKKYRKNIHGDEVINLAVDWKETKAQGKRVFHLNSHTDGYKFYFLWNRWKSRIKCAFIWEFKAARVHSRMLKTYLKMSDSKYKDLYKEHLVKRFKKLF